MLFSLFTFHLWLSTFWFWESKRLVFLFFIYSAWGSFNMYSISWNWWSFGPISSNIVLPFLSFSEQLQVCLTIFIIFQRFPNSVLNCLLFIFIGWCLPPASCPDYWNDSQFHAVSIITFLFFCNYEPFASKTYYLHLVDFIITVPLLYVILELLCFYRWCFSLLL